jgi:uncharacterized membrane-anchored protein YhcB (DUF1043 family)
LSSKVAKGKEGTIMQDELDQKTEEVVKRFKTSKELLKHQEP